MNDMDPMNTTNSYHTTGPTEKAHEHPVIANARRARQLAIDYSLDSVGPDGHWYGELRYVLFLERSFDSCMTFTHLLKE